MQTNACNEDSVRKNRISGAVPLDLNGIAVGEKTSVFVDEKLKIGQGKIESDPYEI